MAVRTPIKTSILDALSYWMGCSYESQTLMWLNHSASRMNSCNLGFFCYEEYA